jgi:hypothetical protein
MGNLLNSQATICFLKDSASRNSSLYIRIFVEENYTEAYVIKEYQEKYFYITVQSLRFHELKK